MTQNVQQLLLKIEASTELARREIDASGRSLESLDRKSTRTQRQLDDNFKKMDRAAGLAKAAIIGFVGSFSVASIARFGRSILEFSDDLATAADQAGIGVERYQTLTEALRTLEISGEAASNIFARLQDAIGQSLTGSAPKLLADALERLGLQQGILSGEITTTEQAFDALSRASGRYRTQAEFAADVAVLVGRRNGTELAAALKVGEEGIRDLESQARASGTVISAEIVDKFAEANEVIDQFYSSTQRGTVIWAAQVIPLIKQVAQEIQGAAFIFENSGLLRFLSSSDAEGAAASTRTGQRDFLRGELARQQRLLADAEGIRDGGVVGSGFLRIIEGGEARINLLRSAVERTRAQLAALNAEIVADDLATRFPVGAFAPRPAAAAAAAAATGNARLPVRSAPEISTNELRMGGFSSINDAQAVPLQGSLMAAMEIEAIIARLEGDFLDLSQAEIISPEAIRRAEQFGENLSRNLAFAVVQGQNLGDALVNSLKAAAAEAIASGLLGLLTGGGAGGGLLGSLFGGFFADGGRPPLGRVSVVGERGPELFVPRVPGTIIPNGQIGMGGITINQTIAPNFAGNAATRDEVVAMGRLVYDQALEAVARGNSLGVRSV